MQSKIVSLLLSIFSVVLLAQAASPDSSAGTGLNPPQPTDPNGPVTPGSTGTPGNISIRVTPGSTILRPGQSIVFETAVEGTRDHQVRWSLNPNLGSMVKGVYTAPSSFVDDSKVTISATSVADPSKTATATVLLVHPRGPIVPARRHVSISITSGPATLAAGQSAQFIAVVEGLADNNVNWSVTPNVGVILNGMYTAPANIATQETIRVTATSVADPLETASVPLELMPPSKPGTGSGSVTVSLSPGSASLIGGQKATFLPAVTGSSNTTVTWSLSPQVGTISNGIYQAPPVIASQQTITLTATSAADSTKSATAMVALQPIALTLGPSSVSVGAGASAAFDAAVTGASNPAVSWSLNPALGTIMNGIYTAPANVSSQQTVTVTAASVMDPTKTASASISLTPLTMSLSPASANLTGGQTAAFTFTITGIAKAPVTWTLNPQVGSIANGVYQAPAVIASAQSVTVTATSMADTSRTATALVWLTPVGVTVGPAAMSLGAGASANFSAAVTGTSNAGVTWSLNPAVGTIANGVYTAPASISSQQTVTVTATSVVDSTKSATATVTLTPVGLSLSPTSVTLNEGQSATFTSAVVGTGNTAVTWSLSPQVGSITNGVYHAPSVLSSQQTVTVTATSVADSTKSMSAAVSLVPIGITLSPPAVSLGAGASATFAASVTGASNSAVKWSLNPAVGTIVNGVYTAPATISSTQTVTITAASVLDSTKTATATVTLTAVNLSLSPQSVTLNEGQSTTFTPLVSGASNPAVTWTLIPPVGTISNGVYHAPSVLAGQQTITVTASVAGSSKIASATVSLIPIGITVGPTAVSLGVGGSANFAASVSGTGNTAVTWSLNPAVGSIVNGAYTAPASIGGTQTVTLTVASVEDPTRTATATITLTSVSLSLSPVSALLDGGQSATFTPLVSGSSNAAVTWSLNPAVGTISNGVYRAPAIVASQQTVTVTATSVADSTKTSRATVSLQPIAVTVGPASVSLSAGGGAAFAPTVTGTNNPAVTWSLNPALGTIANGIYAAPATIASAQTVMVTAASVVDPTKTATASISLTATVTNTPPPPPPTTVTLPVEVLGQNGTTVSSSVTIPSGSNLTGQLTLAMQIHGLRTGTQASVQVNNSAWLPISNSTVTLLGNATAYGGIGGGFATLSMTMNLPSGVVQTGANTINFRFNQTDGRVSGFRVLAFNIQSASGTQLIPTSTFVQDDPNTWQPPSTAPSDITAGQTLWRTAALTIPLTSGGTKPILAHCMDCHTQDGRDLKYFNYSNNSIQTRAVFHGLTSQQGNQIASYIRTLNVPNPGRVWNPPYQPGPGLDSQPVSNWAAGAGLSAVLNSDADMINAIFPSGFQSSVFAGTSDLNQRELPLPVQLPDWNQWLPGTHPMDAFGAAFTSNGYNTIYQTLSSSLQVNDPAGYVAQQSNINAWFNAFYGFYVQEGNPIWNNPTTGWTPAAVDAMYSLSQWGLVKTWELNSQFQLEGYSQNIFGPQADPRAWYSNMPFFVSPHELKMPNTGVTGLRNGTGAEYIYLSYIWYNLQLILNDSNGKQTYQYPIDWSYVYGFVQNLGSLVSPQSGIQTMWMIKGLQVMQQLGAGPQMSGNGWQPFVVQPSWLVTPEWNATVWTGVDATTRTAIATGIATSWLQQVSQFTPQQFYAGGWTTATAVPVPGGNPYDSVFPDWVWYMIPRFGFLGVNPTLVNQLAAWAQTVWPKANWTADANATCSWQNNNPNYKIQCSQ